MGRNFRHLVEVGHRIADAYKQHVAAFRHALLHFGTADLVDSQDRTGKWKQRRQLIRQSLERGELDYLPDRATLALVGFLMPGTQEKLEKLALKATA